MVVSMQIRILVAGGCDGWCEDGATKALRSAEIYNPEMNEWTEIAPLPVPLNG